MIYCDTSLLATGLLPESGTEIIQRWLARHDGKLAISPWVHAEFLGAIARKQRMSLLTGEDVDRVAAIWASVRSAMTILPITPANFDQAGRLTLASTVGLRAADALHLAIAAQAGHSLASLDRRLLLAAIECGIAYIDPLAG